MKRLAYLFAALCLALAPAAAQAAIGTPVNNGGATDFASTTVSKTPSPTINANDYVCLSLAGNGTVTVSNITIAGGGSISDWTGSATTQGGYTGAMYCKYTTVAITGSIQVTWSGAVTGLLGVQSVSGVDPTTPIATAMTTAVGNSTAPSHSITPAATGDMIFSAVMFQNQASTYTDNFSGLQDVAFSWGRAVNSYQSAPSTSAITYTGAGTDTRYWVVKLIGLKAASGGGGSAPKTLMTLGIGDE